MAELVGVQHMGNKGPNVLSSFRASRFRLLLNRFSRWLNRAIDVELRGEHSCELSPRAFVPLGQRRGHVPYPPEDAKYPPVPPRLIQEQPDYGERRCRFPDDDFAA
jgi:hypothetical protein